MREAERTIKFIIRIAVELTNCEHVGRAIIIQAWKLTISIYYEKVVDFSFSLLFLGKPRKKPLLTIGLSLAFGHHWRPELLAKNGADHGGERWYKKAHCKSKGLQSLLEQDSDYPKCFPPRNFNGEYFGENAKSLFSLA